ncbi:MAG: cytochrome c assembly protein [Pedosphaera sp.]|nr:cytochrome c assembly protein [Pedosphaera sp.]
MLAGLVLHTAAMFRRGFSLERCPITNLFEATMFVAWTISASYAVLGGFSRLRFLGAFASPVLLVLGVFALMPALDRHRGSQPDFSSNWGPIHAALVLLAYGAFGLGSMASGMYLRQEHNLRFNTSRALFALLPPIARLEVTSIRLLCAGLAFLSAGLMTGSFYLLQARGKWFVPDPFVIYSLVTWSVYSALLIGAWRFQQRGRRLAWGAVIGFAILMLTFWGVYMLSEMHNRNLVIPSL